MNNEYLYENKDEGDPLFYNSRPLNTSYNKSSHLSGSRYGSQSYSGNAFILFNLGPIRCIINIII